MDSLWLEYGFGGDSPDLFRSAGELLTTAYTEKGRHYHTLKHIRYAIESDMENSPYEGNDEDLMVRMALWFHDVYYNR